MLFADGDQALGVGVQLFQTVSGVDNGNDGKDHALVAHGQVIHVLPGVFPLLLHGAGHLRCEVVLCVLPLLPAGDVGLHTKDNALHFLDRLVCRHGDQVNGEHEISGKLSQVRDQVISHKGGIASKKQYPAIFISHLKMVFPEAHAVRADQLPEVCSPPYSLCVVILEILLLSGAEEVMEDAKPLIVAYGFQPGVQT